MRDRNARLLLAAIVALTVVACGITSASAQDRPAEAIPLFKIDRWSESLAFGPDSQRLACDLGLTNLNGKELAEGEADKGFPYCKYVAFSPDGKWLASIHLDDGGIRARHAICLSNVTADNKLQRAAILQPPKEKHPLYPQSIYTLIFSQDSRMLATREPDDSTIIWETASGKEQMRLDTQGLAVAFSPNGRTLTAVTRYGLIQHWDLPTKKCVDPPANAKQEDFLFVEHAIASADCKTLVITDGHSVVFKDAARGKTLRRFDNLHPGRLAVSPDGKTLAVSGGDGVALFDRQTGKESGHLSIAANTRVSALAISPDAKAIAVALQGAFPHASVTAWEIAKLPSARKKEINRDIHLSLYLTGDGAINHPEEVVQTEGFGGERKKVTLAPGKTYEIPIRSLDGRHGEQSYWLLPGEYTLHAGCHVTVRPAPDGDDELSGGLEFVKIEAPPLRLKVVAEKSPRR